MTVGVKIAIAAMLLFVLPAALVMGALLYPWVVWYVPAYLPSLGVVAGLTLALVAVAREADPAYASRLLRYAVVVLVVAALSAGVIWLFQPGYMDPLGDLGQ